MKTKLLLGLAIIGISAAFTPPARAGVSVDVRFGFPFPIFPVPAVVLPPLPVLCPPPVVVLPPVCAPPVVYYRPPVVVYPPVRVCRPVYAPPGHVRTYGYPYGRYERHGHGHGGNGHGHH